MNYDLSILIPARNEIFLSKTVDSIVSQKRGNTQVIAVCDGYRPDPPVADHPDVVLIYHSEPIGQRAATNEAARVSQAKYIVKMDAHCHVDEGFDIKLIAEWPYEWTVIPRMYNLHAFDWLCSKCGWRQYQGPQPAKCGQCESVELVMDILWNPRWNRRSDFARFDKELHFQYWSSFEKRPGIRAEEISDLLCHVGACWGMHRERFWELGGCDENHGGKAGWGQMGVEISLKSWLSGGRQVVNKRTWFSHMFRTQPGWTFPYPINGREVEKARQYSRDLWRGNNWPKAVHTLDWLIDRFKPIPDWHEEVKV